MPSIVSIVLYPISRVVYESTFNYNSAPSSLACRQITTISCWPRRASLVLCRALPISAEHVKGSCFKFEVTRDDVIFDLVSVSKLASL